MPETGDPVDLVERELALLARKLELTARRSDLFGSLDRASYLILRILDERGPAAISSLAAALGLDGSTVTASFHGRGPRGTGCASPSSSPSSTRRSASWRRRADQRRCGSPST